MLQYGKEWLRTINGDREHIENLRNKGLMSEDDYQKAEGCVCVRVRRGVGGWVDEWVRGWVGEYTMGGLRLVGSLKLQVSFAKEPCKRCFILRKRPIILRSLLIVATPYL